MYMGGAYVWLVCVACMCGLYVSIYTAWLVMLVYQRSKVPHLGKQNAAKILQIFFTN